MKQKHIGAIVNPNGPALFTLHAVHVEHRKMMRTTVVDNLVFVHADSKECRGFRRCDEKRVFAALSAQITKNTVLVRVWCMIHAILWFLAHARRRDAARKAKIGKSRNFKPRRS
jgi:hypothetical protein